MSKTTTVDLRELTEPFDDWCARHGISRSRAVRQLVATVVGGAGQSSLLPAEDAGTMPPEPPCAPRTDLDPPYRFTLRLNGSERQRLKTRARETGMSCGQYLIAALSACEAEAHAIAGKDAVLVLLESNDLLAQALRTLRVERGRSARVGGVLASRGEDPHALIDVLRKHLAHASAVLSAIEATRVRSTSQKLADARRTSARQGRARKRP